MSTEPISVALIIGSVRDGRFGPTVAHWFADHAKQCPDLAVDVIDLVDVPLPLTITGQPDRPTTRALAAVSPRLAAADAFVFITPEYNHSFPASVKTIIDWHRTEWRAKPVGFVSYGAVAGGLRAVEHLRQVFAELHAVTVRDTVSFHNAWDVFDPAGQPKDAQGCSAAARLMLDELVWWGRSLREAKENRPYPIP